MEDYRAILDDTSRELLNWMKRCKLAENQRDECYRWISDDTMEGDLASLKSRHAAERAALDKPGKML